PSGERSIYEQQINDFAYRQVTYEFEKLDGKFAGKDKQKRDDLQKALETFDELKPKPLPMMPLVSDIGSTAPVNAIPKRGNGEDVLPGLLTLLNSAPT